MNGFGQPPLPNQPQPQGAPQFVQPPVQQPQFVQPPMQQPQQQVPQPAPVMAPVPQAAPVMAPAPQAAPAAAMPAVPAQVAPQQAGIPGIQVFEPDMEEIRLLAEKIAAAGPRRGPSDFYYFKTGDNYIRILPPWSAARKWVRYGARHYNLLGSKGTACYESMNPGAGYSCPIDRVLAVFKQFVDVSQMERRGYQYCNGLVYDYDEANQQFVLQRIKPYVLQLPIFGVHEPLVQLMGRPPFHKLMDPYQGCIVNVNRPDSFQGKKNYTVRYVQTEPLAPEESGIRTILSQLHNLDTFADFAPPSMEKLQAQVELADALATALAGACQYTRTQLAQWGLLPETLQLEGAVPAVAMQGMAVPTAQGVAMPVAAVAQVQPAPAQASPFPVSPVALPAAVASPALVAPVAYPAPLPVAAPVVPMAPAPVAALPPLPQLPPPPVQAAPMPSTAPVLPVQVQGSASPAQATVATVVPPMATTMAPTAAIPTPVRPGEVAPQPVIPAAAPGTAPAVAAKVGESICPVCNKGFAGVRGLKLHLAKSACGSTVAPQPQAVAPQAVQPIAPAPVAAAAVAAPRPPCFSGFGTQVQCPACPYQVECASTG